MRSSRETAWERLDGGGQEQQLARSAAQCRGLRASKAPACTGEGQSASRQGVGIPGRGTEHHEETGAGELVGEHLH